MSSFTEKHSAANDKHDLKNKHALIVGGNQGIGFGAAQALAKRGASVIIAGRNEQVGSESVSKLKSLSTTNADFKFEPVDLAEIADVKRFASALSDQKFDFIVWSAGYFPYGDRQETKDGIERSFAVNYLSRYIGINLLLPTLKKNGRVLAVLAPFNEAHSALKPQIDFDDLEVKNEAKWKEAKHSLINAIPSVANDVFINSIAKKNKDLVFFHQQPGYIRTNLFSNSDVPEKNDLHLIFGDLSKAPSRTPEEYGETAVFLLTDADVAQYSGRGVQPDATPYEPNEYILNKQYEEK